MNAVGFDASAAPAAAAGSRRKIRVAVMLTPVEFGGAERVCLTLLENIDRTAFDVVPVLLTRPWEQANLFLRKLQACGYAPIEVPVALKEHGDPLRVLRCLRLAWGLLGVGQFDLLHTHGYFADIVGIPAARLRGIPTISTCHGYIPNTWKVRVYNAMDRFVLRFGTGIMAVSEGIRKELLESGVRDAKVSVVVNAVEAPEAAPEAGPGRKAHGLTEQEFVVGYVGRLSVEKGLSYLLEACVAVAAAGVPLKVLIVGDGPQRKELEQLSSRLGLGERIRFVGFQEDIGQWLSCMDVFVLPSLTEGTPMALLEAMARGLPVVASAVGGVPLVIDDRSSGLLVKPAQAQEIGAAILKLNGDPAFRRSLAQNGRDVARTRYGVDNWIGSIESAYRRLTKARAA